PAEPLTVRRRPADTGRDEHPPRAARRPALTSASSAYQTVSLQPASPGRLVAMLYDGCLRFLRRAESAATAGQRPQLTEAINRATAIVMERNATLDMDAGGEIASNLRSLYLFLQRHLLDAAREGDA